MPDRERPRSPPSADREIRDVRNWSSPASRRSFRSAATVTGRRCRAGTGGILEELPSSLPRRMLSRGPRAAPRRACSPAPACFKLADGPAHARRAGTYGIHDGSRCPRGRGAGCRRRRARLAAGWSWGRGNRLGGRRAVRGVHRRASRALVSGRAGAPCRASARAGGSAAPRWPAPRRRGAFAVLPLLDRDEPSTEGCSPSGSSSRCSALPRWRRGARPRARTERAARRDRPAPAALEIREEGPELAAAAAMEVGPGGSGSLWSTSEGCGRDVPRTGRRHRGARPRPAGAVRDFDGWPTPTPAAAGIRGRRRGPRRRARHGAREGHFEHPGRARVGVLRRPSGAALASRSAFLAKVSGTLMATQAPETATSTDQARRGRGATTSAATSTRPTPARTRPGCRASTSAAARCARRTAIASTTSAASSTSPATRSTRTAAG